MTLSRTIFIACIAATFSVAVEASTLDTVGVTALQTVTTNINGSGIRIGQPEAEVATSPPAFEINPADVGQPVTLFTYASSAGTSTTYPNALGTNSWHAEDVANAMYGNPGGVATNVAHVDNLEANYFYSTYISSITQPSLGDPIINQSFTFGNEPSQVTVSQQQQLDTDYDNYSVQNKTLFVSAANNGGSVSPPGTSYNCISVGAYGVGATSSIGPTLDNGRCKPDITAPAGATSFSTPLVSGSAAVLMQAALRGDGGGATNAASDMRTIKALLMNGAIKPANWTNSTSSPLDARYGAGVVNVFNAYEQLAGGRHVAIASTTVSAGGAHPPNGATGNISALSGWDFNTNTSSSLPQQLDAVNHYYFNVTNSQDTAEFTLTATLAWNRQKNQTAINNLDLFLYNAANSNLVAVSTSAVDNVEHIFVPKLPQGRYDLEVWKAGGAGIVSASEAYALAWEFFSESAAMYRSGTNTVLSWQLYPAGFVVEGTTNLVSPSWTTNGIPSPVISNAQNVVVLNATNGIQFFRLRRP